MLCQLKLFQRHLENFNDIVPGLPLAGNVGLF
jgi:hypothetical protein